jgi:chromosome partitioning protein
MITYAVALEKGGVGKTALSVNLAAAFQQAGLDVLLIDLDAQASATHWLGVDVAHLIVAQFVKTVKRGKIVRSSPFLVCKKLNNW